MYFKLKFLVFFFFIKLNLASAQIIVLDPGHGGNDKGVIKDRLQESQITLSISLLVEKKINQQFKNYKIFLTRSEDRYISLADRIKIAKDRHADLFLSLHANSSTSEFVNGFEFYFKSDKPIRFIEESSVVHQIINEVADFGLTQKSLQLAESLQLQFSEYKNVIRRESFFVLENNPLPSVLVEVGFLTHKKEALLLNTESYQDKIAQSIVNSISNYFNSFDVSHINEETSDKTL